MTGTALYELVGAYRALAERLADADFDAQTIADTIEASGIVDELQTKAQGVELVARSAVMHVGAINAEIARLQALKDHREKVAAGLRAYLKKNMEDAGMSRIECPLFTLTIKKNPPAVEILDEASIPVAYWTAPKAPEPKPNKTVIASLLKAGEDIPGVRLTQSTRIDVS